MRCRRCEGTDLIKRGRKAGHQRYSCRACGRYSTDRAPKFSAETKAMAIEMYMNSMGIRAIGRVLQASPAAVLGWIRKEHAALQQRLARQAAVAAGAPDIIAPDIIEMDEIYTYVQKRQRAVVWTAYSRRQRRVVAYHIGDQGVASAIAIYRLAKQAVGRIEAIFTDANSCYALAFARHGVPEPHTQTKAQTHLIESSNASIRDMLARFNRRSKRSSKTHQMLEITLDLFFNRKPPASPT